MANVKHKFTHFNRAEIVRSCMIICMVIVCAVCSLAAPAEEAENTVASEAETKSGQTSGDLILTPAEISNGTKNGAQGLSDWFSPAEKSEFDQAMSAVHIPNVRNGEAAYDINDLQRPPDAFISLGAIPEQNIYLYGFENDEFTGIVFDTGKDININCFPIPFHSPTLTGPDLSCNADGTEIYLSCMLNTGTGLAASQLFIFQRFETESMEGFYISTDTFSQKLNQKISMSYCQADAVVTIFDGDRELQTVDVSYLEGNPILSYCCGNIMDFIFEGNKLFISFTPGIVTEKWADMQYDNIRKMKAEITFISDGYIITDISLGDITVMQEI